MKIKSYFFTIIGVLMPVLFFTSCSSPGNQNSGLKTKDDLIHRLKECKHFADSTHLNVDSALTACGIKGGCNLNVGQPPSVCLSDTLYIYFGQDSTWFRSQNGPQFTIKTSYYSGAQGTTQRWSYIGLDSAKNTTSANYECRFAIPLNNYKSPMGNMKNKIISQQGPQ